MKAKWTLLVSFMVVIVAVAPNSAYAARSQAGGAGTSGGPISDIPPGVKVVPDIAYREGPSKAWRLDLAMPKAPSDRPRPAIVFVHGGGWRSGDKRKSNFLGPTLEFAAKERTDSARARSFMSTLFAGPQESLEQRMKQASPMTYVTADAPPFLITRYPKEPGTGTSGGRIQTAQASGPKRGPSLST